jgi:hypothetical protein
VTNLVKVMQRMERKLGYVLEEIQSLMSDGTVEERLALLRKHFQDCDKGDKDYLTPDEFCELTKKLGCEMSEAELDEAILMIDDNGDGQVDFIEYIEWWSEAADDADVLLLFEKDGAVGAGGGGAGGGDAGAAAAGGESAASKLLGSLLIAGSGDGGPSGMSMEAATRTAGEQPAQRAEARRSPHSADSPTPSPHLSPNTPGRSLSAKKSPVGRLRRGSVDDSNVGVGSNGGASFMAMMHLSRMDLMKDDRGGRGGRASGGSLMVLSKINNFDSTKGMIGKMSPKSGAKKLKTHSASARNLSTSKRSSPLSPKP